MQSSRLLAFIAASSIVASATAAAQCPNGTPPPCDSRQTAQLTLIKRAPAPRLDDKTYIVLPFTNVSRAPDADWLSDAAVNMLSMDMGRWQDIKVIDDRRVADYLRDSRVPNGARLSMSDALAVARRAGAGRVIIGDVLKVGSRTAISATLVNATDGRTIRTAREETSVADSLMSVFGKIARQILAVPATDVNAGSVGTTSVGAYKEYVSGNQALNKFDAPEAKKRYEAALKLDSNFALAHYKWAIAASYDTKASAERQSRLTLTNLNNIARLMEDPDRITHARAAARLSASLPARERALIAGLNGIINEDFPRACESYRSLARADSSDVEALYGYGACLWQDDIVEPVGGDTTNMRFRTSWNDAMTVFRRAASVDPTFHLAFDAIVAMLTSSTRSGCLPRNATETCRDTTTTRRYVAPVGRAGDSIVTKPESGYRTYLDVIRESQRRSALRTNVEVASRVGTDWVTLAPAEGRAHKRQMELAIRLGRTAEAEQELAEARKDPSLTDDPELFIRRMELAVKSMRGPEAIRLIDSLPIVQPTEIGRANAAIYATMTGRFALADAYYRDLIRLQSVPAEVVPIVMQSLRVVAGVPGDSLEAIEKAAAARFSPTPPGTCAMDCVRRIGADFILALRAPRTWMTLPAELANAPYYAPAYALSRNDTAALRVAAHLLDSVSQRRVGNARSEDGTALIAAEAYLALTDTGTALRIARRLTDTTLQMTSIESALTPVPAPAMTIWPRAILMRADLEAAKGDKRVAKDYYTNFLSMWAKADPEFAPLLARVRAARDRLP